MKFTTFTHNSSPHKSRKKVILLVVVAVLLVAVGSGIFVWYRSRQSNKLSEQKSMDEAQTDSAKQRVINNDYKDSSGSVRPPSTQTTDQIPVDPTLSLSISNVSHTNRTVTANAIIKGANEEGLCVFSYTAPESKPVIRESKSSSKSCSSSVYEGEFDKLGAWNLNVVFYISNIKAEANQSVTINY